MEAGRFRIPESSWLQRARRSVRSFAPRAYRSVHREGRSCGLPPGARAAKQRRPPGGPRLYPLHSPAGPSSLNLPFADRPEFLPALHAAIAVHFLLLAVLPIRAGTHATGPALFLRCFRGLPPAAKTLCCHGSRRASSRVLPWSAETVPRWAAPAQLGLSRLAGQGTETELSPRRHCRKPGGFQTALWSVGSSLKRGSSAIRYLPARCRRWFRDSRN